MIKKLLATFEIMPMHHPFFRFIIGIWRDWQGSNHNLLQASFVIKTGDATFNPVSSVMTLKLNVAVIHPQQLHSCFLKYKSILFICNKSRTIQGFQHFQTHRRLELRHFELTSCWQALHETFWWKSDLEKYCKKQNSML